MCLAGGCVFVRSLFCLFVCLRWLVGFVLARSGGGIRGEVLVINHCHVCLSSRYCDGNFAPGPEREILFKSWGRGVMGRGLCYPGILRL